LNAAQSTIFAKFIVDRQDASKMRNFRLAA
jgi:hypothetical protein